MKRFSLKTEVVVGTDALEALTAFRGKRVSIVTDGFMAASGLIDRLRARLPECPIEVFSGVVADPPLDRIALGVGALTAFSPDVIVALGGGSSIDAAKAILAVLAALDGGRPIPLVAIPTTSGSGSEVTNYAIVSDPTTRAKYPVMSDALQPSLALLDPDLVRTVPAQITADTGMDVITHAIEAYVAAGATDFSDAFAEKAVALAFANLPRAVETGDDLEARAALHNASCMAGAAFTAAGLGLNHALAHAIGGRFHLAHGRINAMLLPSVIAYNAGATGDGGLRPVAARYAELARRIGLEVRDERHGVASLIAAITVLNRRFAIPATLTAAGLDMTDYPALAGEIVASALADPCSSVNPREPTEADVARILDGVAG